MKSLAELKRDAKTGNMYLEMTEWYGKMGKDIPDKLCGIRRVLGANTMALCIQTPQGKQSELRLECAGLIEYDGKYLTVYDPGYRDLTEEERNILDEWQKIEDEYYRNNPLGDSYYKRKSYFKSCPCPWLAGYETVRGKYLEEIGSDIRVRDDSIKGVVAIRYNVIMKRGV